MGSERKSAFVTETLVPFWSAASTTSLPERQG